MLKKELKQIKQTIHIITTITKTHIILTTSQFFQCGIKSIKKKTNPASITVNANEKKSQLTIFVIFKTIEHKIKKDKTETNIKIIFVLIIRELGL
jgi:hypothetical protein